MVHDCGPEQEHIVKSILYLLTDENGARPLKTKPDLDFDLDIENSQLDLILDILVRSRLVSLVPAIPQDYYQLVHDYLLELIRKEYSSKLVQDIEKERKTRILSEARLNKMLQRQVKKSQLLAFILITLTITISVFSTLIFTNSNYNSLLCNLLCQDKLEAN